MLWRALKHVKKGFYVDIGAQDPVVDSVSLGFYLQGWRGIHVEPTPHYAELLRQRRPDETVIQAAVGSKRSALKFFEIPDTGLSTGDPKIAERHRAAGYDVKKISVPCITLASILKSCAGREIHWLKVDVEGMEDKVLRSWRPSKTRPWIVVVESTRPLSQIKTHGRWEPVLLRYGYTPVYFDGLNRYYVSTAHLELKDSFRCGPNIFDEFTLSGTASAPFCTLLVERFNSQLRTKEIELSAQRRSTMEKAQHVSAAFAERRQKFVSQLRAQREIAQRLQEKCNSNKTRIEDLNTELQASQNETQRIIQTSASREMELRSQVHQGQKEIAKLSQLLATREKAHTEQSNQIQNELENLQRTLMRREHELAAHLLAIQQQGEREKAEQVRKHGERERALRRNHADREQILTHQLQSAQQELESTQRDRAMREQVLFEQTSQVRQELEASLRVLAQREQELGTQIFQGQQEISRLSRTLAAREQELGAQLSANQNKLKELIQTSATRERELQSAIDKRNVEIQQVRSARDSAKESAVKSFLKFREGIAKIQERARALIVPIAPLFKPSPTGKYGLGDLFHYYDEAFIHAAYRALLKRAPDESGLTHFLGSLRKGAAKIEILGDIRRSPEGKSVGVALPGLAASYFFMKSFRWPVLGRAIRFMAAPWILRNIDIERRALANQLGALWVQVRQGAQQISSLSKDALRELETDLNQPRGAEPIATSQLPTPDGLKQLSSRAREIYLQLKTAASHHAEREA